MRTRRKAREFAMQALFSMDMCEDWSLSRLKNFLKIHTPPKGSLSFIEELISGVIDKKAELDTLIENTSINWKISRIACVDRNIVRIAVYEMLYCDNIPYKVSINEAVDIGKFFGDEGSGAFINGLSDNIMKHLESKRSGKEH